MDSIKPAKFTRIFNFYFFFFSHFSLLFYGSVEVEIFLGFHLDLLCNISFHYRQNGVCLHSVILRILVAKYQRNQNQIKPYEEMTIAE